MINLDQSDLPLVLMAGAVTAVSVLHATGWMMMPGGCGADGKEGSSLLHVAVCTASAAIALAMLLLMPAPPAPRSPAADAQSVLASGAGPANPQTAPIPATLERQNRKWDR